MFSLDSVTAQETDMAPLVNKERVTANGVHIEIFGSTIIIIRKTIKPTTCCIQFSSETFIASFLGQVIQFHKAFCCEVE
jgi:hypothetical protein